MIRNKDLSPPTLTEKQYAPVDLGLFYGKNIKVYWIDGQFINEDTLEYTFDKKMPALATLHIPIVCRFLYSFDENDNPEDKYKDAHTGAVSPPPPLCPATGGKWKWVVTAQEIVYTGGEYLPPLPIEGSFGQYAIGSVVISYESGLLNPGPPPQYFMKKITNTKTCTID